MGWHRGRGPIWDGHRIATCNNKLNKYLFDAGDNESERAPYSSSRSAPISKHQKLQPKETKLKVAAVRMARMKQFGNSCGTGSGEGADEEDSEEEN